MARAIRSVLCGGARPGWANVGVLTAAGQPAERDCRGAPVKAPSTTNTHRGHEVLRGRDGSGLIRLRAVTMKIPRKPNGSVTRPRSPDPGPAEIAAAGDVLSAASFHPRSGEADDHSAGRFLNETRLPPALCVTATTPVGAPSGPAVKPSGTVSRLDRRQPRSGGQQSQHPVAGPEAVMMPVTVRYLNSQLHMARVLLRRARTHIARRAQAEEKL